LARDYAWKRGPKKGLIKRVGDGSTIRAFEDAWIPTNPNGIPLCKKTGVDVTMVHELIDVDLMCWKEEKLETNFVVLLRGTRELSAKFLLVDLLRMSGLGRMKEMAFSLFAQRIESWPHRSLQARLLLLERTLINAGRSCGECRYHQRLGRSGGG
jgi:hypothetical protein